MGPHAEAGRGDAERMSRELRSDIKELQIAVYQSLGLPEGRRAAQEAGFVSPNTCVIMNLSDRAGALLTQPLRSVEKGTICSLMAMAKKGSVSTVLVRWLGKGRPSALRRLLPNNNNKNNNTV